MAGCLPQGVNLQTNDLIKHNLVVFNNGDGALKTLPGLVDVIPEARLNLVSQSVSQSAELVGDARAVACRGRGWD
jgi:hypothetical protein